MMDVKKFVDTFSNQSNEISVKFAVVDGMYSTGNPKLLFDGENEVSRKGYTYLGSYTPTPNERVMLINDVIIDRVGPKEQQTSDGKSGFATIDPNYSTGNARVTFDGETGLSEPLPCLKSYDPMANHRVLVQNGVILGEIDDQGV